MELKPVILFSMGSGMISVGSGFGLIQSFSGNLFDVTASIVLFISGFRLCQHSISQRSLKSGLFGEGEIGPIKWTRPILFAIGVPLMSQGFIFLMSSVETGYYIESLIGGGLIIGGYVPAHLSVNETFV